MCLGDKVLYEIPPSDYLSALVGHQVLNLVLQKFDFRFVLGFGIVCNDLKISAGL